MRRLGQRRNRFEGESVDPMQFLSNLSDAMLVLAVGMMLALIVHWNVDISTSGGVMSDSGVSYAAEGDGGSAHIDKNQALELSGNELEQLPTQELGDDGEGMEKLGEVYFDAATGQYYIIRTEEEAP